MDCRNEEDPICIEHNNITFAEAMERADELLHKIGLNNFFVDGVSAISIAEKLISHISKYSWHDPEDLPVEGECVVTAHKMFGHTAYAICTYENGVFDDGINPGELMKKSLFAWKYIEPCEWSEEK